MALPDEDVIREWCRLDQGQFDDVLPVMIAGASRHASHITGRDYATEDMPENVQMWVAAQVSHWITNPDALAKNEVSPYMLRLLDPDRLYL